MHLGLRLIIPFDVSLYFPVSLMDTTDFADNQSDAQSTHGQ